MNRQGRVADSGPGQCAPELVAALIAEALLESALPDEVRGFGPEDSAEAARFVTAAAVQRNPGTPVVRLQSVGGGAAGRRRMRLAVINDDMPFLVDSVAAALGAHGLTIHRLLHPVVHVRRDRGGCLVEVTQDQPDLNRESFLYVEVDRANASLRQILSKELEDILADVRASVSDWRALQDRLKRDSHSVDDEETSALLNWFADGAMTLLGYEVQEPGKPGSQGLGLLRPNRKDAPLWDADSCRAAIDYFQQGGEAPIIAKADRRSTVHRRVPLDLIVLPIGGPGQVTGIGIYAGLWTSQALRAPVEEVPVLRRRLAKLQEEFDFDTGGHAGKALRHAFASLPRDLLVSLDLDQIKQAVATAMSLADRPRPTLALLRSVLKGHVFAFLWLPRDELATRRREAIGAMLATELEGAVSNWTVDLDEGGLALLRYTLDVDPAKPLPSVESLNARLIDMVRGWEPSVEEALMPLVGTRRASRLALSWIGAFPESYRTRTAPPEAAQDLIRLAGLTGPQDRDARLYGLESDGALSLRLKTYRLGDTIALSDVVPVLENFGFRVLEEQPTRVGNVGTIHDFLVEAQATAEEALSRSAVVEQAIVAVLESRAENDGFNQLLISAALDADEVVLFRAWFRYLRQIGLPYGLGTAVEALRKTPSIAQDLNALFRARHDPSLKGDREGAAAAAGERIVQDLGRVAAIDEDRILRLFRSLVEATLRTNAFAPACREALAFKFDSSLIPGIPRPTPWREIWVYSARVEGIHLRAGPIARGGIRWSDRRDDFRTEILGLMKAQIVKNAVIVPTGAKGGFYPKQLPPATDREAWMAEGTEAYRIFIRALLSVTDNIVGPKVAHPSQVVIRDGEDPYLVVAADKGTATFSDVANDIAESHGFWLGDAFASGGSNGYDHKAMGITARGAWISIQRHFAEMGVDVQQEAVRVAGCGDMSGDVFGNGMLRSPAIKLVAAFDHRHIFIDPDPDPARSWAERKRLFELTRSSWNDYDKALITPGGGIFPRTQKSIPLTPQVRELLDVEADALDPSALIRAILTAPVDLLWFGGIGTFVKASDQREAEVGDPGNADVRVDAADLRAKVVGEGANLAVTQAARIEFAERGGRINTDFIDNSAGVDCSDHEVNIKIPLNREVMEGRLGAAERNQLLKAMTEEVAAIVLEDNRLQTLALSIAEWAGAASLPSLVRAIDILEESGRFDREVEGFETNERLLRRMQEDRSLTRPELAVLLATSKIALQDAIEPSNLPDDPTFEEELMQAFPEGMRGPHRAAIAQHRLRRDIIATQIANRFVNRLGILAPFALSEEEGTSWSQAAAAFVAAERLFDMPRLWTAIETLDLREPVRIELLAQAAAGLQVHIADILRSTPSGMAAGAIVALLRPGLAKLDAAVEKLLRHEARAQAETLTARLTRIGAPETVVGQIVRLFKMNGAVGIAALGRRCRPDEVALTRAYTKIGEALGLDWAQSAANRFAPSDLWERQLAASLARDFEQMRLDFLERNGDSDPEGAVDRWLAAHAPRIAQFRKLVARARAASAPTIPMLAQIATQARVLLAR